VSDAEESLERAVAQLRRGGVVAAATETFFGLLADVTNPVALDALYRLKPRGAASALIVSSEAVWSTLVEAPPRRALALARAFWPGPLTLVLRARAGVDPRLLVDGTIGVRIPGPSAASRLCRAMGTPLTATSANAHGQPPAAQASNVRASFPDASRSGELYVVEGQSPGGLPSTLVRIEGERISVIREGAIAARDIEAASRSPL
jgi:L-threonylcarbamoyladenylate synthase